MVEHLVLWARVIAIASCIVFMVLLPRAVMLYRPPLPGRIWVFIAAVELAWLENVIRAISRIHAHAPWLWDSSPLLFASSVLGAWFVVRAGNPRPVE